MANQRVTVSAVEKWRADAFDCWQRLPNKGLFFALLVAWLALFQFLGNSTFGYVDTPSLLHWMYNAYNNKTATADDGHGNLIPFVVLALFWWKRKELLRVPMRTWWPAMVLLGFSVVLHVLGYVAQQPRISVIALFGGVYALMGLTWGHRWLQASFFPFFLFAFCVPFGSLGEQITVPLRLLVTYISVGISHVLGVDVIREGSQIFDSQRSFRYDVAPACSGIRSLVSLLALTTIYAFVSFRAGWKRLVMVAAAFPLAVVGNVVRITFVILVAEAFGQEAGAFVEQKFGFVTFAVAIACVLLLGYWLREAEPQPVPAAESKVPDMEEAQRP